MGRVLVVGVAGRFQLERRVFDVEVAGQAALQRIEQLRGMAVVEAGVVDDHVCGEHRQPRGDGVHVQVVHALNVVEAHDVGADLFEIDVPLFGRPLRNALKIAPNADMVRVRAL